MDIGKIPRGKYLLPLFSLTFILALCQPGVSNAQDPTGRPSSGSTPSRRRKPPVKPVVPEPMTVILTILTEPSGCQVLINNEDKGLTSAEGKLVLSKLPMAHYDIEVRKEGFEAMKKAFLAGTDSPTLVFKLRASLDNEVSQFNQLVAAAKLTVPESPNAFDLVSDLSAKYPDRAEVATMRSTLLPKLAEIADAAVAVTLSKWRGLSRAEIERGIVPAESFTKLKSDDNRAAARVAYLKGVLAMRDWLIGPPGQKSATHNGSAQSAGTQSSGAQGTGNQTKTPADLLAAARDNLGSAVQLDSSWAAAAFQLGRLLLFSGNPEAAQSALVKATQIEPNWAAAHTFLADAYYAAGKRKESIPEYQKAIKQDPASARAYAGLGLARSQTGDSKEGLKDIEKAIQLDPSSGLPHLSLGIVYSEAKKKKDREKGVEELNEAIKKNPDSLEFQNKVAQRLITEINERDKK
jgi:tetratricopeptide (TPR) repeat protein